MFVHTGSALQAQKNTKAPSLSRQEFAKVFFLVFLPLGNGVRSTTVINSKPAMDPLSISFDGVRDKNVEQLKVLNRAIFPINYSDKVYADILACADVSQLAYHNDVCVGAIACRLEKQAQVRTCMCCS